MRTLNRNKQRMYYALKNDEIPIYELDEDGNIIYIEVDGKLVPVETGETKSGYGAPVEFFGNIAMSGGEAEAVEFGLNLADYSAVLVTDKGLLPIDEKSRIWHTTEPKIEVGGYADGFSADYTVVKVSPSLNFDKFVLKKIVK